MSIQENPNTGEIISEGLTELEQVMPTEKSKKIVGISSAIAAFGGFIARLIKRK